MKQNLYQIFYKMPRYQNIKFTYLSRITHHASLAIYQEAPNAH